MIDVRRVLVKNGERVLLDISFSFGKSLALVGESGSGKSLTLKALLGLLPPGLEAEVEIDAPFELVRGESVAFVPQNPFTALSPMTKIEKQWFASKERASELFEGLGLRMDMMKSYPPQLSGGELQRMVFAMALASEPKLLLLDEPTTALDPVLREEIADLLVQLHHDYGFAMLFVSHDIKLASLICEESLVIRNGREVERGESERVLKDPIDPYTRKLIEANFAQREFRR